MILSINLITWVVLLLGVSMALFDKKRKVSNLYRIIVYICYVILIFVGMFTFHESWIMNPILTIIKIAVILLLMGLIDTAFAYKIQGRLTGGLLWTTLICCVVVGIFTFLGVIFV